MPEASKTPVYQLLLSHLKKGFKVLDPEVRQEIITFLKHSQDAAGGFTDRAGTPDLYYSLFGLWLCQASEQNELLKGLNRYQETQSEEDLGPVEQMALILIRNELNSSKERRSLVSLFRTLFQKGKNIGLSYRFFLLTLVLESVGRNTGFYYFMIRLFLFFYRPGTDFPCSLMAALVYARKRVGLRFGNERQQLLGYSIGSGGFRAFHHVQNSDMLSTGVALFVLRETDSDLRMLAPATLEFVQQNYSEGAFLSGDGDETRDLEYTFYGLLALGSLVKDDG